MCGQIHAVKLYFESVKLLQLMETLYKYCKARLRSQEFWRVWMFVFQVEQSKVLIKEGGVQLTLTIVDTPGFGDAVDNSNWWGLPTKTCTIWFYQAIICSLLYSPLSLTSSFHVPSWQPVINYIDSKCEDFLNAESRVNRRSMPDNRVHCCLYFIAPSGHGWVLHKMI